MYELEFHKHKVEVALDVDFPVFGHACWRHGLKKISSSNFLYMCIHINSYKLMSCPQVPSDLAQYEEVQRLQFREVLFYDLPDHGLATQDQLQIHHER